MSNSLWPHGLKPTRLLHPWNFSGKNTGLGCHFLLQGIFMIQGLNPGLLHCRQMLYCLSHQTSTGKECKKKKKKCICRIPETNTTLTIKYVVVQLTSRVWLFAIPWTVAHQASWSFTTYQSLLKLMSIELVMPCNHLIRHWPLLLPPSVFCSIRVFSNESAIYIRWLKDWSFN